MTIQTTSVTRRRHRPVKALIVGGGIGGLTAAVTLRRVGVEVEMYERAPELRLAGFGLTVMSNAMTALRALDIELGLEKRGEPVRSSQIRTVRGRMLREMPFADLIAGSGAPSVAMARRDLQAALLDAAGEYPIVLGASATGYQVLGDGRVRVRFADGRSATGDVLIGADGINSAVRRQRTGEGEPRDGGFVCWLSVTPFTHPRMTPGYNAHYWGRGQRFGLHDVGHGRVYWWGTRNLPPGSAARSWNGGDADTERLLRAYGGWAAEVGAAIRATPPGDVMAVPAQDRPFLERWGEGPVTLLGDAAHPMMPALGQGGSTAMEDAVVLAQCLARVADPPAALRAYEDLRRERTRTMVEVSARLARMEQLQHPVSARLRDAYLRVVPRSVLARPMRVALTPELLGAAA